MAKRLSDEQLIELVEAAIFVAQAPLSKDKLRTTVLEDFEVSAKRVQQALDSITAHYSTRGVRLVKVGSGYRFQACSSLSPWLSKLWQDKAPRYSRAFLETLSLIAYRQPITRGEIEQVRGVSVSSQTIKTMLEHNWIKVIGHKEVPGKPALYGTTKYFLDHFSLPSLAELPPLPSVQNEKIAEILSSPEQVD
jgi:segregation and condensation protein B